MKVLIVDDNPDIKAMMDGREFEEVRFQVVDQESEALSVITADRFDAVLIDLSMPNIDGLELAHQIRLNEVITQMHNRLAYYTAFNVEHDADTQRVMRREAVETAFRKPIDPYTLAQKVKQWLSQPPQKTIVSYGQ